METWLCSYQGVFSPVYRLVLVGICVGKPLDLTSLAPEKTVKIRTDLVAFTFTQGVTLRTSCLGQGEIHSVLRFSESTLKRLAPFLSSPGVNCQSNVAR